MVLTYWNTHNGLPLSLMPLARSMMEDGAGTALTELRARRAANKMLDGVEATILSLAVGWVLAERYEESLGYR